MEVMSAQEREVGISYRSWIWTKPQKATKYVLQKLVLG
jgi:hypothetical protein